MRVKARYISGDELVLDDCNTVNAIKVRIAALRDTFAPNITILRVDTSAVLPDNGEAPASVQVIISNPSTPDANYWQATLHAHAIAQDWIGVQRAMVAIAENAEETARAVIYSKTLWYYFRDIFGPCDIHDHSSFKLDEVERQRRNLSTGPNQRGDLDLDFVQALIDSGADVNFENSECFEEDGHPPLTLAVWNNHVKACQMVLTAGADVDGMYGGISHLFLAVETNHLDLVRLFVSEGADILGQFEETSLEYLARRTGNANVCRLLLTLYACQFVNQSPFDRQIAFMVDSYADRSRPVDLLHVLLPADCTVDFRDDDVKILLSDAMRLFVNMKGIDDTVISIAALSGYVDMCRICIAAGADVNFRNADEKSVLDYASTDEVRELLVRAGATSEEIPPA